MTQPMIPPSVPVSSARQLHMVCDDPKALETFANAAAGVGLTLVPHTSVAALERSKQIKENDLAFIDLVREVRDYIPYFETMRVLYPNLLTFWRLPKDNLKMPDEVLPSWRLFQRPYSASQILERILAAAGYPPRQVSNHPTNKEAYAMTKNVKPQSVPLTVLLPLYPNNDYLGTFLAAKAALADRRVHLIGAFTKPAFIVDGPSLGYPHYPVYPSAIAYEQWQEFYKTAESEARARFEDFDFGEDTSTAWLSDFGKGITAFADEALYADMVVVTPQIPIDGGQEMSLDTRMMAAFLMRSRTPILALPNGIPAQPVFKNPLIAWKENAEAANAMKTLASLLPPGANLTLLSVLESTKEIGLESPQADAAALFLARKGFAVDEKILGEAGKSIAERILAWAEEMEASLVTFGAFNHPRWMHAVSGTVTTPLIQECTRPMLLVR